jgi:hypothetical protein
MTGRDPLGLSRVSNLLADQLLNGIVTGTYRARYYSLYCWFLWHIAKHEKPKNYDLYCHAFQKRDAAVALSNLITDDTSTFPGITATKAAFAKSKGQGELKTDFRVLPSEQMGPYGQNYSGCLYHLGLTRRDNGMDFVTEGMAVALAETVDDSLAATPYIAKGHFKEKSVPLNDLKKSAERLCVDAINQSTAQKERALLTKLFFDQDQSAQTPSSGLRKLSLLRILHLLSAYEARDIAVDPEQLEEYLIFGPAYYGKLVTPKGKRPPFSPPPALELCYGWWRQFALHQYLTMALEGLLCAVLETIAPESRGCTLHDVSSKLVTKQFLSALKEIFGISCETPSQLLKCLGITAMPPDESQCLAARESLQADNKRSETALLDMDMPEPAGQAARSLGLLAVLYSKWRAAGQDEAYQQLSHQAGVELWAGTSLLAIDGWLDPNLSWDQALSTLIQGQIIAQHDRVMLDKRRLDSCWIELVEGRLRKVQDYEAYFRSSRHPSSISILSDLGLVRETATNVSLTAIGSLLLRKELA